MRQMARLGLGGSEALRRQSGGIYPVAIVMRYWEQCGYTCHFGSAKRLFGQNLRETADEAKQAGTFDA
jgi:hypothetical protein